MLKFIFLAVLLPFLAQAEVRVARCSFYIHPMFGYGCAVGDLDFVAGDELQITGTHIVGRNNENVLFVEIANSTIEVIPQQYFINFRNINRFQATEVSLSTLNRLGNCENLETLVLSSNNLQTIANDIFADCSNLLNLQLQSNVIASLSRFALRGLSKLRILNLNNNDIDVINADLFTETPELLDLGISNNNLETLNSRTLTPITNLEILRMANNRFTILNVNILETLTQLQTLLLNGNQFDNFQANFFRHLPNLRQLNLNDNLVSATLILGNKIKFYINSTFLAYIDSPTSI